MRFRHSWVLALVLAAFGTTAFADPPAHAPAHGWRKKHDPGYVGYSGDRWENDYEVSSGRCNREQIGAVLGGVAGGVIGSKVASPDNRPGRNDHRGGRRRTDRRAHRSRARRRRSRLLRACARNHAAGRTGRVGQS